MTAQTSEAIEVTDEVTESILIPEDVLAILQALSPERRQQVFDFAEFLGQKQEQPSIVAKRTRDLDRGAVTWISDDFDDPLPDDFWFGENDPLMMTDEQIKQINQASKQA
jgi:hypothetical protein